MKAFARNFLKRALTAAPLVLVMVSFAAPASSFAAEPAKPAAGPPAAAKPAKPAPAPAPEPAGPASSSTAPAPSGAPPEPALPPPPPPAGAPNEVKWIGTMFSVMMKGDIASKVSLADLAGRPHLYAVGVLEGLMGEITVIDGAPSIARVREQKPSVERKLSGGAALLIYASVPAWRERALPADVTDEKALEAFIGKAVKDAGLDNVGAVPFRVKGRALKAGYHIIDLDTRAAARAKGDTRQSALLPFELANAPVEIVGFWADHGGGIISHHPLLTHMHVVTVDGARSGHLDTLTLGPGGVLLLPVPAPAPVK